MQAEGPTQLLLRMYFIMHNSANRLIQYLIRMMQRINDEVRLRALRNRFQIQVRCSIQCRRVKHPLTSIATTNERNRLPRLQGNIRQIIQLAINSLKKIAARHLSGGDFLYTITTPNSTIALFLFIVPWLFITASIHCPSKKSISPRGSLNAKLNPPGYPSSRTRC